MPPFRNLILVLSLSLLTPRKLSGAVGGKFFLNRGRKVYEMKKESRRIGRLDGNVLAVVSDMKIGIGPSNVQPNYVDYYKADIVEMTDYYPFGMQMVKRHYVTDAGYRFGFQGQEGDGEWNGAGNMLAFKYRVHDARLGRFLSIDPLAPDYPWNSPYAFSENRVIDSRELEGRERLRSSDAIYVAPLVECNQLLGIETDEFILDDAEKVGFNVKFDLFKVVTSKNREVYLTQITYVEVEASLGYWVSINESGEELREFNEDDISFGHPPENHNYEYKRIKGWASVADLPKLPGFPLEDFRNWENQCYPAALGADGYFFYGGYATVLEDFFDKISLSERNVGDVGLANDETHMLEISGRNKKGELTYGSVFKGREEAQGTWPEIVKKQLAPAGASTNEKDYEWYSPKE